MKLPTSILVAMALTGLSSSVAVSNPDPPDIGHSPNVGALDPREVNPPNDIPAPSVSDTVADIDIAFPRGPPDCNDLCFAMFNYCKQREGCDGPGGNANGYCVCYCYHHVCYYGHHMVRFPSSLDFWYICMNVD
jgi:hypothetical protein